MAMPRMAMAMPIRPGTKPGPVVKVAPRYSRVSIIIAWTKITPPKTIQPIPLRRSAFLSRCSLMSPCLLKESAGQRPADMRGLRSALRARNAERVGRHLGHTRIEHAPRRFGNGRLGHFHRFLAIDGREDRATRGS